MERNNIEINSINSINSIQLGGMEYGSVAMNNAYNESNMI